MNSNKINDRIFLILTAILALTIFFDISRDEIQPWDEGIYAARIRAAAMDNLWLDQTEQAVGGLYSSAHPPLVIWTNSAFVKLFGNYEFAYRIGTAIFGAMTVLLIFFFFEDSFQGLLASLILSASSQFRFYSQHTQLDIPLTFFILLGFFFWLKYEKLRTFKYLLLTGIAFGLGLWTKIIVTVLIPAVISVYLLYKSINKEKTSLQSAKELLIVISVGVIIFLPWFLLMYNIHGSEFINYYFFYHVFERSIAGVEHNTKNLGYFFYFNQLIVHLPIASAFALIFTNIRKISQNHLFILIAVIVPLILFSIATTKLATYILPIYPLLVIFSLYNFDSSKLYQKLPIISAAIIIIFQIWSYFPFIRNNAKNILYLDFQNFELWQFAIILISSLILLLLYSRLMIKYALFIIFTLQIFSTILSKNEPEIISGVKAAADYYYSNGMTNIVHIRPKYNSQVNNPQVIYYFNLNKIYDDNAYNLLTDTYEVIDIKSNTMIIMEKGIDYNLNDDNLTLLLENGYYSIFVHK